MEQENYLTKLHTEMLEILDEIIRVCNILKINYYLTGGTLLGAVRHNGFIPWDDDLDIIMNREDFEAFIEAAPRQLHSDYYLAWFTTDKKYYRLYAKVCKRNTIFLEKVGNNSSDFGIFVDIFPIDYSDGSKSRIQRRKKMVKALGNMLTEKKAMSNYKGLKRAMIKMLPEKLLLQLAQRIMISENRCSNKEFFVNYGSQYPIERWTINCECFGNGRLIPFENRFYNAPDRCDEVLKSIFGEHYMEIPPENKRKTHYPLEVKFSDGTSMKFEQTGEKLKIKDILD